MIYVAAPYNHADPDIIQQRMEKIYEFIAMNINQGVHVITPLFMHEVVIRHKIDGSFRFWDKYCLNMLKRCDKMIVLCLDGWKESVGVEVEIQFCKEHNIPVEYIYF